jgi:hypothetical protein
MPSWVRPFVLWTVRVTSTDKTPQDCDGSRYCPADEHILGCFRSKVEPPASTDKTPLERLPIGERDASWLESFRHMEQRAQEAEVGFERIRYALERYRDALEVIAYGGGEEPVTEEQLREIAREALGG